MTSITTRCNVFCAAVMVLAYSEPASCCMMWPCTSCRMAILLWLCVRLTALQAEVLLVEHRPFYMDYV